MRKSYDRHGLDESLFDPTAPLGVPRRYRHEECSRGKRPCLIITRTESGWFYCCHRCGIRGYRGLDGLSPAAVRQWFGSRRTPPPRAEAREVRLPDDFTPELPPAALAWFLAFGLDEGMLSEYRIGYSHAYARMIFPVYMRGRLCYWQGRTFGPITGDNPKWLSVRLPRHEDVWFVARRRRAEDHGVGPEVVVVEDILSALKVSYVRTAVALLGSYIPDSLMWRLRDRGAGVTLWLDRDKTDRALHYMRRFRAIGVPTRIRSTTMDPKAYSPDRIQTILSSSS